MELRFQFYNDISHVSLQMYYHLITIDVTVWIVWSINKVILKIKTLFLGIPVRYWPDSHFLKVSIYSLDLVILPSKHPLKFQVWRRSNFHKFPPPAHWLVCTMWIIQLLISIYVLACLADFVKIAISWLSLVTLFL